ncbi:hypothetical protein [Nonomuraea sp. NPDC049695]|uniref:hypothetical protein n=1 Tax=Nonomuraea sp. NPDC049695 TaxID=3154734 RepID=UPI00341A9602
MAAFPGRRSEADRDGDLLAAYARLTSDPDPAVRAKAARDWAAWEDTVISLESDGKPGAYGNRPPDALLALARICSHYYAHAAWLEEGALLRSAHRLAGIPGALIHGRFGLGAPLQYAWELAQVWPDARLVVAGDAGHTGSTTMNAEILTALDRFAG